MEKLKYFLNKKLIWLFLLLLLLALIPSLYYLYQYYTLEIKEQEDLFFLDQNQYNLFLENLEPKENINFIINPFKKELINQEN